MSQVVKCVRYTNDRTNDHANESLPINNQSEIVDGEHRTSLVRKPTHQTPHHEASFTRLTSKITIS